MKATSNYCIKINFTPCGNPYYNVSCEGKELYSLHLEELKMMSKAFGKLKEETDAIISNEENL